MILRLQSLICILENNNYFLKSLKGFKADMPDFYLQLKKYYEETESYTLLQLLVNEEERLDANYMIWVKDGGMPLIFERKDKYTQHESNVFSARTNIENQQFVDIMEATSKSPSFTPTASNNELNLDGSLIKKEYIQAQRPQD